MGEGFTAVADDLSAMHYNPAGLVQIWHPELALMHDSYLDSGYYETIGYAYPFKGVGTAAACFNYLNYGSVEKRDSSGNLVGSYNPFDASFSAGIGFPLVKDLSGGLRSQWIRQDIDGVIHTGMLWDMALFYNASPQLSFGMDLKNIGVETGGYNLPTELLSGAAYRFFFGARKIHSLIVGMNGDIGAQGIGGVRFGAEYGLERKYFARAGYSHDFQDSDLGLVKGTNFGVGALFGQFQVDYAFTFMGDLGNVQRLSMTLLFPPFEKSSLTLENPKTTQTMTRYIPVTVYAPVTITVPAPQLNGTSSAQSGGVTGGTTASADSQAKPLMLNFQVTSDDDMTAQQLFEMGLKKETAGLYQEAVDYYLKATKKDPNFKQAWGRLGRVYFDRSLEAYRKILEMDPSNTKLREWLSHYNQ